MTCMAHPSCLLLNAFGLHHREAQSRTLDVRSTETSSCRGLLHLPLASPRSFGASGTLMQQHYSYRLSLFTAEHMVTTGTESLRVQSFRRDFAEVDLLCLYRPVSRNHSPIPYIGLIKCYDADINRQSCSVEVIYTGSSCKRGIPTKRAWRLCRSNVA